jgi:hypothetical protein
MTNKCGCEPNVKTVNSHGNIEAHKNGGMLVVKDIIVELRFSSP